MNEAAVRLRSSRALARETATPSCSDLVAKIPSFFLDFCKPGMRAKLSLELGGFSLRILARQILLIVSAWAGVYSFFGPASAATNVQLAVPLFSHHMVLQAGAGIPLWGTAAPNESIIVQLIPMPDAPGVPGCLPSAGCVSQTIVDITADSAGNWQADLNPTAGRSGPYSLVVSGHDPATGSNSQDIKTDVMVGEVWVCSGQSNMKLGGVRRRDAALYSGVVQPSGASHPSIRWQKSRTLGWQQAGRPAAACFWFAADLSDRLLQAQDPALPLLDRLRSSTVGVINKAVGGTEIQLWFAPIFQSDPDPVVASCIAAEASNITPSRDYNRLVAPLLPPGGVAPFRGVIWWQGERQLKSPLCYMHYLPALIRSWRIDWGGSDLPFAFVQLPAGYGLTLQYNDKFQETI